MQSMVALVLVMMIICLQEHSLVYARVFNIPSKRLLLPTAVSKWSGAASTKLNNAKSFLQNKNANKNSNSITRKKFVIPVAGAMAASIAELATYPLDIVKVNMQVSRGKQMQEAGIADLLNSIIMVNGLSGLWRGFPAALLRQIAYQVFKVMLFEPLTALIVLLTGANSPAVSHMLLGGGLAGSLGAFLTTPFDRVKVRTQILGGRGVSSSAEGLKDIFTAVRRLDWPHITTLYTGAGASCQRAFLLNAAELTSYKVVKSALIRQNSSLLRYNNTVDNTYTHLVAALSSGFIASAVSAPIDRAKTLIMASPGTYSGILDCLSDVFVKQGLVGLYKGFFATWLRLAPFTILFFLSFEYFKSLLATVI
jgi:hypothetical protein